MDSLRRDQAKRWDRGEPVLVESYLEQHPTLWSATEQLLADKTEHLIERSDAERMPADAVASLTRNANRGRTGYEELLSQESLDFVEVLKDYHTANFLNNDALAAEFEYDNPVFNTVSAIPTEVVDGLFEIRRCCWA